MMHYALSRLIAASFAGSLVLALSAAASAATGDAPAPPHAADDLVGCYAQGEDGKPTIRIIGGDGQYLLRSIPAIHGDPGIPLNAPPASRLMELPEDLGRWIDAIISHETGAIQVIRFSPDAVIEGEHIGGQIHFLAPQVGGPLTPVPCPDA